MNNENRSRTGRALGLVIASVLVTTGCSESHAQPDAATTQTDAALVADGALPSDAAFAVDAAAPDTAVAMVDASTVDAGDWVEDANYPDAYYPDGIRG
jgi:hypothetical protein